MTRLLSMPHTTPSAHPRETQSRTTPMVRCGAPVAAPVVGSRSGWLLSVSLVFRLANCNAVAGDVIHAVTVAPSASASDCATKTGQVDEPTGRDRCGVRDRRNPAGAIRHGRAEERAVDLELQIPCDRVHHQLCRRRAAVLGQLTADGGERREFSRHDGDLLNAKIAHVDFLGLWGPACVDVRCNDRHPQLVVVGTTFVVCKHTDR